MAGQKVERKEVRITASFIALVWVALDVITGAGIAAGQDDAPGQVEILPVWPGEPPSWSVPDQPEHDTSKPDSEQIAGRPVVRLGYVSKPELHVYRAKGDTKSETAVIVCPGGGYWILAWDLEGTEIARWLQSIGITAAVLKYRVPTQQEEQKWLPAVQDLQRSISLIRSGAIDGFTAEKVGVLGFSAGGNASARTATASKRLYAPVDDADQASPTVDFAVLVYPGSLVDEDEPTRLIDDIQVNDRTPPMFFAHARDDRVSCLGSVTLFTELQRRNIAAALHVFAGGGHGFGARIQGAASDQWPDLCAAWMRDQGWLNK
jgi:endo-1,4-beta-xylanase